MKKPPLPRAIVKKLPLPRKFQGATVVRGLAMASRKLEALLDRRALEQFDATRETFLVVEDGALGDDCVVVRCFLNQADAIRCARALSNGNIDHRVLRVSDQTLVIATENKLYPRVA